MSNPQVELHVKNYGVITLELDADKAPKCTANFLAYVNKGHYNNTIFHRIIPGFMVQGGGMEVIQKIKAAPTGAGGPFPTDVPKTPILINSATLVK